MLILQLNGTIVLYKDKRDFRTSIREPLRFLIELLGNSQVRLGSNSWESSILITKQSFPGERIMKRLVLGGLSLLLVVATATPALKATAATVSPQIHTAMATTSQAPVSPWLMRVTETRASKVAVVNPTTISTATVNTASIPAVSPWLIRVNQTRGSLKATFPTAG